MERKGGFLSKPLVFYAVVLDNVLYLYENNEAEAPLEEINLEALTINFIKSTNGIFTFKVAHGNRLDIYDFKSLNG